ncbi:S-adenosyl-L-methionine-dependent methyltransferase [Microthyrium microscopicum]|uniref:S-adenosyl-L-methionine-dependent methyltransferase n=1 Tax=Microthyrium microscopicum TaxID=703497 RepID=A0A6A6U6L0_9PEZI|nr:S-adenosyl-L-methionine-dependent methyltransferase [Microthyrium microscopicum]
MAFPSVQTLRELQKTLNSTIDSYVRAVEANDIKQSIGISTRAYAAARDVTDAFCDPGMAVLGAGLEPIMNLALRIAIDLDLFILINESVSLAELVKQTKAEDTLLHRILRVLVGTGWMAEPEIKTYSLTKRGEFLKLAPWRDWIKTSFDSLAPVWLEIPEWLRKNGYRDIIDLKNNPSMSMYGVNWFDNLAKYPSREADFASSMKLKDEFPQNALPQFPYASAIENFEYELQQGGSDVFLVDVGGGRGQYLNQLLEHSDLPENARFVLQDLSTVVSSVIRSAVKFEPMSHDFFSPQPIKGAKYYHLRAILHNWPDDGCYHILSLLKDALKAGYSRLLINAYILPELQVPAIPSMIDVNMWLYCGKERTENEWHALLRRAGLKVLRIVRAEVGLHGIIEAALVDEINFGT